MKKFISILLAAVVMLAATFMFVGCDNGTEGKTEVNVAIPTQIPSLSLLKMLSDNEQVDGANYKVSYELKEGAPPIQAAMLNGEPEIVIAPTNIIAAIWKNSQPKVEYQIVATTSFGNFFIITTDGALNDINDLKGQTVDIQGGPGGPYEFLLKALLDEANIDYDDESQDPDKVTIKLNATAGAVAAGLAGGTMTIGLLPEPALTAAKGAITQAGKTPKTIVNIQEAWAELNDTEINGYPLACLAIRSDFLEDNKEFCTEFARKVKESVEWVKEGETDTTKLAAIKTTLDALNTKLENDGKIPTGVSGTLLGSSITNFNIGFQLTNKEEITNYLKTIVPSLALEDKMFYTEITLN